MKTVYESESQIKAIVDGFESCTTAKDNFRHSDHLTVAVWYLRSGSPQEALEKMRLGLNRFLDFHGIDRQKYKEDLTVAWINLVHRILSELDPNLSVVEIANIIQERLGDKNAVFESGNLSADCAG